MVYIKLFLLWPTKDYLYNAKSDKVDVKIPNMCPFCDNRQISGRIKVIAKKFPHFYIEVFTCDDHSFRMRFIIVQYLLMILSLFIPIIFLIPFDLTFGIIILSIISLVWIIYFYITGVISNNFLSQISNEFDIK